MVNRERSGEEANLGKEQTRAYVAIVRLSNPADTLPSVENLQILMARVRRPDPEGEWEDKELLTRLIKVLEQSNFDVWTIPGGGLEPEEMAMEEEAGARRGAAREVKAEVGANISPDSLVLVGRGDISYLGSTNEQVVYLFRVDESLVSGKLAPGPEMDAIAWMNIQDVAGKKSFDLRRGFAFVAASLFGRNVLPEIAPILGLPENLK